MNATIWGMTPSTPTGKEATQAAGQAQTGSIEIRVGRHGEQLDAQRIKSRTVSPVGRNTHEPRLDLAGKHVHFVGIGGCGMSGLARIVRRDGAICSGSDLASSAAIDSLLEEDFHVQLDQSAETVPDPCDLLVISAAIHEDHPEALEARRRDISVIKYAALLGQLMSGRTGVAVAGTHGKSTTTSLLGHVLILCGIDPSIIVGATCPQIGGGWRCGESDVLVAEACEFDRSFHNFLPRHAVILNVEEDHLDVYNSINEIVESFAEFARLLPGDGTLLIQHELPHRLAITAGLDCEVQTIGFAPQADWCVQVTDGAGSTVPSTDFAAAIPPAEGAHRSGFMPVNLYYRDELVTEWCNPMAGEHMAYNAAAAAVMAHRLGASWPKIAEAIATFRGLDRRMELLGQRLVSQPHDKGGLVTIVDDYGHHPTEIDTTLRALRRCYDPKRLVCVFQPHQHSRTRFLMEQFAASFSQADLVIVPHIYFVRDSEQERHAVRAADLVDRLRTRGKQAMHLYPFDAIVEQLELIAQDGDLIVTMGAGDVWRIGRAFLNNSN